MTVPERLRPHARAWSGFALQAVGSLLIGAAVGHAVFAPASTATVSAAPAAYHLAGACTACPSGVAPESVEVQRRSGSTLFVVRGAWPASVDMLHTSVRLLANSVDLRLTPHGSMNAFEIGRAGAPLARGSVAAGIQGGALLLDVADSVVRAPVRFAVGLWDGARFLVRLPSSGLLLWNGSGAPQPLAAASPGAPPSASASPSPSAAPSPTPEQSFGPRVDLTAFAGACPTFPSGTVPPYLVPTGVTQGHAVDPRTGVDTPYFAVHLTGPVPTSPPPPAFTVTLALLPTGATSAPAPGGSRRQIDGAGNAQLYAYYSGGTGQKGIRTRSGSGAWTMLQNEDAGALTVVLSTDRVTFYWNGLLSNDRALAVSAAATGCVATSAAR